MTEIAEFIRKAQSAKKELIASTIRLTPEEHAFIEEFANQYSLSRQEAMHMLMRAGIEEASKEIERSAEVGALTPEAEKRKEPGFHILNTNKRHNVESHERMLREGVAAAFYGEWKFNINRIQKGDVVFLYENGKGIVAYGRGTGETLKAAYEGNPDEMHYQILSDFALLEKPLTAAEVKKILNRNVVFLKTMSGAPDGQKILDRINGLSKRR